MIVGNFYTTEGFKTQVRSAVKNLQMVHAFAFLLELSHRKAATLKFSESPIENAAMLAAYSKGYYEALHDLHAFSELTDTSGKLTPAQESRANTIRELRDNQHITPQEYDAMMEGLVHGTK